MLSLCLTIAAHQSVDTPKIEGVLEGPNASFADSAARWKEIGKFVRRKIEEGHPKNQDELQATLTKAGLQSNDNASFGMSVIPIQDRKPGYIVWMSTTSRTNPEKLSRQASFLYLWERGHVASTFLGASLLKSGFVYDGRGQRHGNDLLIGGTNGGKRGEGGYGPAVAIAFRRTSNGWRQTVSQELSGSGKLEEIVGLGGVPMLSYSLYTNHSKVLRSHYESPTFIDKAVIHFNGKAFVTVNRRPLKNRYWVVSHFIEALQNNNKTAAQQFTESPALVEDALKAGIGTKGIVWDSVVGSRGDEQDLQINTKIEGVWYSISLWFKGESLKITKVDQYQPKK